MLPNKNNIYGDLLPPKGFFGRRRTAGWIAKQLGRHGCHTHQASWGDDWDISSEWLDINCVTTGDSVLLGGAIADFAGHLDSFCVWLESVGVEYKLELYDADGNLVKELRGP